MKFKNKFPGAQFGVEPIPGVVKIREFGQCGFCKIMCDWFDEQSGKYACSEAHLDYLRTQFRYREG